MSNAEMKVFRLDPMPDPAFLYTVEVWQTDPPEDPEWQEFVCDRDHVVTFNDVSPAMLTELLKLLDPVNDFVTVMRGGFFYRGRRKVLYRTEWQDEDALKRLCG